MDRVNKDTRGYCTQVEKALALKDPSLRQASLHLLLFNGYFQLGQEDLEMLKMAADHLYLAQLDESVEIQKDNRIWLAEYYYQRSDRFIREGQWKSKESEKIAMQEERKRAISLIEKNLTLPPKETLSPQEEADLFRLANLFFWDQNQEKSCELFQLLYDQYQKAPGTCWTFRENTLLSLAQAMREKKETEKAIALYEEVISLKRDPGASMRASFEKCLLRLSLLTEEEKIASSPIVESIVLDLKQIKLQRKLETEPLHFEAALALVDLQVLLEKTSSPFEKKLSLLRSLKEDFFASEDVLSKDYHEQRKKMNDKELLIQSYLRMVDSEILLCKMFLGKEKAPESVVGYGQEARCLIRSLLEENFVLTSELYVRIHKDKELLEKESKDLSLMEKR
jgi:tetratricopeptide (TPR) repeat protein